MEVSVHNQKIIGRTLSEVTAELPTGVQVFVVREGNQNLVPSPEIILKENFVLALTGESAEALESARVLIGESAPNRIIGDRGDLDYFLFFVSKPAVVGVSLSDFQIPGVPEFSVVHVRRGDADLLPRPQLVLEFGDRVGVMIRREHRDITRKYLGDSIKGTTEFSYVSLGVGMALGMLLGILPIPIPGLGILRLGHSRLLQI